MDPLFSQKTYNVFVQLTSAVQSLLLLIRLLLKNNLNDIFLNISLQLTHKIFRALSQCQFSLQNDLGLRINDAFNLLTSFPIKTISYNQLRLEVDIFSFCQSNWTELSFEQTLTFILKSLSLCGTLKRPNVLLVLIGVVIRKQLNV